MTEDEIDQTIWRRRGEVRRAVLGDDPVLRMVRERVWRVWDHVFIEEDAYRRMALPLREWFSLYYSGVGIRWDTVEEYDHAVKYGVHYVGKHGRVEA